MNWLLGNIYSAVWPEGTVKSPLWLGAPERKRHTQKLSLPTSDKVQHTVASLSFSMGTIKDCLPHSGGHLSNEIIDDVIVFSKTCFPSCRYLSLCVRVRVLPFTETSITFAFSYVTHTHTLDVKTVRNQSGDVQGSTYTHKAYSIYIQTDIHILENSSFCTLWHFGNKADTSRRRCSFLEGLFLWFSPEHRRSSQSSNIP